MASSLSHSTPSSSSSPLKPAPSSTSSAPTPPPVPVETHPNRASLKPHPTATTHNLSPDPTRLAPEDAYSTQSQPRPRAGNIVLGNRDNLNHAAQLRLLHRTVATPPAVAALRPPPDVPGLEPRGIGKDKRHRILHKKGKKKAPWKKLLWVKQAYPDNYTDSETFLDHLQRNPRLRPYDFWPLVADFTVIVQHVCSVVIFVCCFAVIIQERVSPISVVSCGSICTILGWVAWDFWDGKEQSDIARALRLGERMAADNGSNSTSSSMGGKTNSSSDVGLGLDMSSVSSLPSGQSISSDSNSQTTSTTSVASGQSSDSSVSQTSTSQDGNSADFSYPEKGLTPSSSPPRPSTTPSIPAQSDSTFSSARNSQRLATAKSALLIFCALRGLSPILKSLTKSTTSDSIWAMTCWLMVINIFFFDYGSGEKPSAGTGTGTVAAKFPASLSTNAALMASTVLASRLKSTTHVFSLTLFSIEVFGLFPVFRRQLRAFSSRGHFILTAALVIAASAGVGITLKGGYSGAFLGILIGVPSTALVMGGCSWWLIGLQKYKNVVAGPWDPAKPVIRRQWD